MYGAGGLAELINSEVEIALFAMLAELPLSMITNTLAILLILIFFITSADSASFVLGSMTSNGDLEPKTWIKLVWGFLIAGAASVLLFSGGGGLNALQTASIIAALPFAIIMVLMIVSVLITLSKDWKIDRKLRRRKREDRVKGEFKEEFVDDFKEEIYNEMKDELYDDFKEKIHKEIKDEIVKEISKEDK